MLFLVVAVLFGFTTADPTQPGCCVPPQWEGVEGSIIGMVRGGAASVTDTQTLISYDETNQMISANTYTEAAGQKINVKILQDFNKGMQYMINVDQKTCTGTPMPGPFTKVCLPADAELLGKIYFGIGDYIFDALSFRATVNNTRVTVVATRENCIPVLETLTGNFNGVPTMDTIGFVNLTAGIKDRSVFDVPSFCTQHKPTGFDKIHQKRGVLVF